MIRKKSLVLAVVLLAVLTFSAVAGAQNDTLVIGTTAEAVSLDPRLENDESSFERINTIMEPLLKYNEKLELIPSLAKDWTVSEDTLTIRFVLEEGIFWHDGKPFTAADVKYTFDWVLDESNRALNRSLFVDIAEIEIINDYEIVFRLSQPNGFLVNTMPRLAITPKHDGDRDDFKQGPIGTGPYKFVSWTRDDRLVLEANEDYWGGKPIIPNVIFRPIPEDSTRLLAFEAGDIDIFQNGVVPKEIDRLEANPDYIVQRAPSTGYTYVGYNLQKAPLDDIALRKALCHLINREGIVERVLNGIGVPATTPVTPALPWFNAELKGYEYSPEKAKQILADAGYEPGDLEFRIHTNEAPDRMRIAELLQYECQQVGIEAEVIVEEWGAYLARILDTTDYEVWILGWVGMVDADRALTRQFRSDGTNNWGKYYNERVDHLLTVARTLPLDSQESFDMYKEAQALIMEDAVYGLVCYDEVVSIQHKWIDGFNISSFTQSGWQNIHRITKNK